MFAKDASAELRNQIENYTTFKEKWPISDIIDLTEVPKSTVYYRLSKYKRTGAVTNGRSTGRPRKLTWREEKKIIFLSKTHPKATSKDNLEMLDPEIPVCSGIIRQRLIKAKLRARTAVQKPLMNAINRKKRLDWCQKNQYFDKEYWQNWIFSDESTFELYPKRREFVRRPRNASLCPKYTSKTVTFGGKKLMV